MNTFFCRAFQCCFAVGARFLPWRTPEVFSGEGSLLRAADILRENGLRRPFVIASRRQCADEHFRALQEKLDEQDILLSIFSSVEPNRRWTQPRPPRRASRGRTSRFRSLRGS